MKTVKILRTIIMIAAAVFAAATAGAQTAREYFALGNNAYKAGDYARALENYSLAEKNGFDSAELYFNKANAFAKLDRRGDALLNYKRAVYNALRMREATANLAINARSTTPCVCARQRQTLPCTQRTTRSNRGWKPSKRR